MLKLVRAALPVKPLRVAMLSPPRPGPASLQSMIVAGSGGGTTPPLASRGAWRELATAVDKAVAADKQAKASLAADESWSELVGQLPAIRERDQSSWQCGSPPARAGAMGAMGGEMGELMALLRRMPSS